MRKIFRTGNFLIPKHEYLSSWPVIAVDQYTSQPEYWQKVKEQVSSRPSALNCVLPEVYLSEGNTDQIEVIHKQMKEYLEAGLFDEYPSSYIYIERTLSSGKVRKGVLGCMDLEAYDYRDHTDLPVRATEKTVIERLPSRIAVRTGAVMELSHVILLCDDERRQLIESIDPSSLPLLYDLELMCNGGHIKGWLVAGKDAEAFDERLEQYYRDKEGKTFLFAAGDGNHSIAAAKEVYEEMKKDHPEIGDPERPERYMSVELENLHDPIQVFEPIHRVVYNADPKQILNELKEERGSEDGEVLRWYSEGTSGEMRIDISDTGYMTGTVQKFLDRYENRYGCDFDYIHDLENLTQLCSQPSVIGFELPPLENTAFFETIEKNGVYVRKTFSIGESDDKRFYLETRKIMK